MSRNPNSLKNLRPPWPKGKSANPKGAPAGVRIARLCDIVEYAKIEVVPGKSRDEAVTESLYAKARKGDARALALWFDRVHGKVTDKVDLSSSDGTMSPPVTSIAIVLVDPSDPDAKDPDADDPEDADPAGG